MTSTGSPADQYWLIFPLHRATPDELHLPQYRGVPKRVLSEVETPDNVSGGRVKSRWEAAEYLVFWYRSLIHRLPNE